MPPNKRKAHTALPAAPPTKKPHSRTKTTTTTRRSSTVSSQDAIIVSSIELGHKKRPTGVTHYRQQVAEHESANIHSDSDTDDSPLVIKTKKSKQQNDELEPFHKNPPSINYTIPPTPDPRFSSLIYKAQTTNPAVFLAIIRIAQKNLPGINFDSAINHLPNLSAADKLPKLKKGIPPETLPYRKKESDVQVTILFMQEFYTDRRHAVAFYSQSPSSPSNAPNASLTTTTTNHPSYPDPPSITHLVATPCTTRDLETYSLVGFLNGRLNSVGVKQGGTWLFSDHEYGAHEMWEEWQFEKRVVESVWEGRVRLARGEEEEDDGVEVEVEEVVEEWGEGEWDGD